MLNRAHGLTATLVKLHNKRWYFSLTLKIQWSFRNFRETIRIPRSRRPWALSRDDSFGTHVQAHPLYSFSPQGIRDGSFGGGENGFMRTGGSWSAGSLPRKQLMPFRIVLIDNSVAIPQSRILRCYKHSQRRNLSGRWRYPGRSYSVHYKCFAKTRSTLKQRHLGRVSQADRPGRSRGFQEGGRAALDGGSIHLQSSLDLTKSTMCV